MKCFAQIRIPTNVSNHNNEIVTMECALHYLEQIKQRPDFVEYSIEEDGTVIIVMEVEIYV